VSADPPRLVIDTNVFVSGLISSSGAPAKILGAIRQSHAIHVVSDPIIQEYLQVLDYPRIRKFEKISDEFIASIAAYLIYQTHRVELTSRIRRSRDPDDDVFLQTAVDGKASLLISGDKTDLLSLKAIENIPIVTAREAMVRLGL
jgi:putative PIN family toxin of toxin-antitoxin system